MKKNKSLSNFEMHNSSVSSKNAIHKRTKDEEAIYAETSEKIKRGLGKATASTGTPIASLKGGAKYMTQLSNVGGGSVKIGGGGIKEGFNTLAQRQIQILEGMLVKWPESEKAKAWLNAWACRLKQIPEKL